MQRFFEAFCHNTVFLFQTEFINGQRREVISRRSGVTVRPLMGPGQSPGEGPANEIPESVAYLNFEYLLF